MKAGCWILLALCLRESPALFSQQGGVVGMSERQIRILQERSEWAKNQIVKAQEALSSP